MDEIEPTPPPPAQPAQPAQSQQMQQKKRTSPWVIVLICFGVLGLLVIGAIVLAISWFSANKDKLVEQGKASDAEARAFAKDHDQEACVGEGLRRVDDCQGKSGAFVCATTANVFTQSCVAHAEPAAVCEGAPLPGEIMKTVEFARTQCSKRGRQPGDQGCSQLMQSVARGCANTARAR